MKKAVIKTGSKQYLVSEGDVIKVELIKSSSKNVSFEALLVIDDANISVGTPLVDKITVSGEIIEADAKEDKVTSIRFKAKKRVHKTHGHRQRLTHIKINKIA